jgi:hypothetical protein
MTNSRVLRRILAPTVGVGLGLLLLLGLSLAVTDRAGSAWFLWAAGGVIAVAGSVLAWQTATAFRRSFDEVGRQIQ